MVGILGGLPGHASDRFGPALAYAAAVAFQFPVAVPYFQIDQQGVVFNMWYLGWFDEAMTAYLAAIGKPYVTMIADGLDVQLVHTELDWAAGVRHGDDVVVEVATEKVGRTSFTLAFGVIRNGAQVVTGRTVYVVVATDGSGKQQLPEDWRTALERGVA